MIRHIRLWFILILISVFFCGCSDSFSEENRNLDPAIVGTYFGEDGCILSIFSDGTSEFFDVRDDLPRRNMRWTYTNDRRILIDYKENKPIYAECDDPSAKEYVFKGDNEQYWVDEAYTKIDTEPVHRNGDECAAFVEDNWDKYYPERAKEKKEKMQVTFEEFTYGDVKFVIPSTLYHVTENGADYFCSYSAGALLLFDVHDNSYPKSMFDIYTSGIDTVVFNKVNDGTAYLYSDSSETKEVAGLQSRENIYEGKNTNMGEFHCKTLCLNNCYKDKLIYIYFYYVDEAKNKYDHTYEDIINSAILLSDTSNYEEKPKTSSPKTSNGGSGNTKWCQYEPANAFINRYNSYYPDEPITKASIIGDYMFGTEIQVNADIMFDVGETDGDPSYSVEGFKKLDINNREKFWEYANRLSMCSSESLYIDPYYGDIFPVKHRYESGGKTYVYEENPNSGRTMKLRIYTTF